MHDFQINEADLTKTSDSTDLPIAAQQEAQRYLNQFFLDGKVVTAATAASVTGKNANVTIPYYSTAGAKISSVVFKMAESGKFRSGWFVDKSILSTTYFSSSNLKKIRYPEGSNGTVTFSPKATYRDQGMTFTATLKLYPQGTSYNQYDADEVYYGADPLAEQTFTITVSPLPEDRHVTIEVKDAVSKEAIEGAQITVTKSDGTALEPIDGTYTMTVPDTYTVTASAEGYVVPGSEETLLTQEDYAPKKDGETLTLTLIKAEESKVAVDFDVKDQLDEAVANPQITVYRWDDKSEVTAEADGSYKLYNGIRYGYTIAAAGYEDKTGSMTHTVAGTESVLMNKYLDAQRFTFKVYDYATNETLEGVTLTVKFGPSGEDESTYAEATPDTSGVYTIPIDNRVVAYGSKFGYLDDSLGVWSLGFDPQKDCSFSLKKAPVQSVTFTAKDNKTSEPIDGATFTVVDPEGTEVAAVEGVYELVVGATYKVTAEAADYRTATENYEVVADQATKEIGLYHKNYYYWMQIRGQERIQEQNYSIHGTGEVVKLKVHSTGQETTVPVPEGTYYVLDNLQVGETYTVTVDAPEGYALVTTREWSVPDHAYISETDGETQFSQTFTVTDEKEFLGNIIVNFVKLSVETDVDWTAVDAAIAKVPGQEMGNLGYFTDETAAVVNAAMAAVNRDETDQATVDAWAAAIEDAIKGLVPKDGRYEVTFDKANGTPYYYYEDVLKGTEKDFGMGVLVVENGQMSLDAVLKNTSYGLVYVGTKEEAAAAAPDGDTAPEGAIEIAMDTAAKQSTVTYPVAKFNEQLQYAFHSSNTSRYNMQQGWYDHGVIFRANTVTPLDAEEPDTIALSIYDEEAMFKVVNAFIEKTENGADFVFALSAKGYEYVYAGTVDDALADLDAVKATFAAKETAGNMIYYAPATVECVYETSSGVQNDGTADKYQFRMPITDADALAAIEAGTGTFRLPITAVSNSRANAGNWDSALTARQAVVDLDAAHVRTGNYRDELPASVVSVLETMAVAPDGKINTIGTPSANKYTCQPTFTVTDGNYDAAIIGTAEEAAAAQKVIGAQDGIFVIPLANSLGNAPQIDVETWQATVAFHVVDGADFDQAGTWVERTLTVNPVAAQITLSGDELTKTVAPDDLVLTHVGTPLWVAGKPAEISVVAEGLNPATNEVVTSWQWQYTKTPDDPDSWKKTGAKVFVGDADSSVYIPECTVARKDPMKWRVMVTTSDGRTATSAGQSLTELEKLEVVPAGDFKWVEGQPVDIVAKVNGLAEGETVQSAVWYYSKNKTNYKKTGAENFFEGNELTVKIPSCTEARKAPMAWSVRVTTSTGRTVTSEGISLVE
ncbi:MAG: carboxypeptidase regulatory-like domain-containing protein [Eggerthellaceae bacterium]|nr:carboxypeptidase regulatory-like domain-containing protein [Eggerthellaceae bacterium]